MIKLFFAHRCGTDKNDSTHKFISWFDSKLKQENGFMFDVFIACQRSDDLTSAADINQHLNDCHILLPVVTDDFSSTNTTSELRQARERRKQTGHFPMIHPLLLGVSREKRAELGFPINQDENSGELWEDFTVEAGREEAYRLTLARITKFCVRHNLLADQDFYRDIDLINLVLSREKPTPFEFHVGLEFCRVHPDYEDYFFRHLGKRDWLFYLKNLGFLRKSPASLIVTDEKGEWIRTPHWPVLDFLEKVSLDCAGESGRPYATELMQILRTVTSDAQNTPFQNPTTNWYFIKILSNVPSDTIKLEDVELVGVWLKSKLGTSLLSTQIRKSLLSKFLDSETESDWVKAGKLFCICIGFDKEEAKNRRDISPYMEVYWLGELLTISSFKIGQRCGKVALDAIKNELEAIIAIDGNFDELSYISRPVIANDVQNAGADRFEHIIVSALRDALLGYMQKEPAASKSYLESCLKSPTKLVRRIAIYAITDHCQNFRDLTTLILVSENFDDPYRLEVYRFLEKNFGYLTKKEQDGVVSMINSTPLAGEIEGRSIEQRRAWNNVRWLAAIYKKGHEGADELFEASKKITGGVPPHPEFSSYHESGTMFGTPQNIEELKEKPVADMIIFANGIKDKNDWASPTRRGVWDKFSEMIKANPEKYFSAKDEFLRAQPLYQAALFRAADAMLMENQSAPVDQIIELAEKILVQDSFWIPGEDQKDDELRSFCFEILRLCRTWAGKIGTSAELSTIEKAFNLTERILKNETKIAVKVERSSPQNTVRGEALMTLFELLILDARRAKTENREKETVWSNHKDFFDQEAQGDRKEIFAPIAAGYLHTIHYLSSKWLRDNISFLFPTAPQDQTILVEALNSYLGPVTTLHVDIYKLLRSIGALDKGLDAFKKGGSDHHKLIEIISLAFILGVEEIEGEGLFSRLMREWNPNDLSKIIWYFWSLRDGNLEESQRNRIFEFWRVCYQKTKNNPEKDQRTLSDLCLLAYLLVGGNLTDEQKEWLLLSAPYVEVAYHAAFFLEYLDQLADKDSATVATVYCRITTNATPDFKAENVCSIIRKLYQAGYKKEANQICTEYARKGNVNLLKNIRDEFNP